MRMKKEANILLLLITFDAMYTLLQPNPLLLKSKTCEKHAPNPADAPSQKRQEHLVGG